MSGHSKWSKIKREKQVKDKQKGNLFSKLSRLITLAVGEGGGIKDPENNIKLRLALEKAKNFNLPKVNIERAIEKGIGPDRLQLKEMIFEAFAPGGISIIITATSYNVNRTISEVRNVVEAQGGKIGEKGSVLYLFKKCGLATFEISKVDESAVFSFADKIASFDIDNDEKYFYVFFPYELLSKIREYLNGLTTDSIEVDYKANSLIEISNKRLADRIQNLVKTLEDLDDVQGIFTNAKNI